MTEREWVDSFIPALGERLKVVALKGSTLAVEAGKKLPYAFDVLEYNGAEPSKRNINRYETDILVYDLNADEKWIPRVIIECKLGSVTTHDAITYSAKSVTHKNVHPYLRYGILIGRREHHPLPARLIRHGVNFDFMASWAGTEPSDHEWQSLMEVLVDEVKASRRLQEILTNSRSASRTRYTMVHKPLKCL